MLPVNQIITGDCLQIMKGWPDGCVDLVLTDPPYDEDTHKGALHKSEKYKEFGIGFKPLGNPEEVLNRFIDLSKTWIIIFCSLEMLGKYQNYRPEKYVRGGVWDRISNAPQLSGDRPAQAAEGLAILHSVRKHMKWNGHGTAAIWRYMVERGQKLHQTQKPLSMLTRLTLQFSYNNQIILDPYCGSGTTCVAAKKLGRNYIGIDISEEYCEIARQRLDAVDTGVPVTEQRKGQLPMFE